MRKNIEKESSPKEIVDYDPEFEGGIQTKDEYTTKEQAMELIVRTYKSTRSVIEKSNIRNKHEALLISDKTHCIKEIEKIKIAICENEIGTLWIKEGCPKFPEWANSLVDSKVYNWINNGVKKWYIETIFGERSDFDEQNFRYNIYELDVIDEKIIPFFKMYFEIIVLQNIIKKKGIEPSNIEKKAGKPKKTPKEFEDYLTYPNKAALVTKIRELINDNDKRYVAMIIMAMEKKQIIHQKLRKELYDSMRNRFGDIIGRDQNLNTHRKSGGITQEDIDEVVANLLLNE